MEELDVKTLLEDATYIMNSVDKIDDTIFEKISGRYRLSDNTIFTVKMATDYEMFCNFMHDYGYDKNGGIRELRDDIDKLKRYIKKYGNE